MNQDEFAALSALRFNWTLKPDDVWRTSPEHVPELHSKVANRVLAGVTDAQRSEDSSPLGLIIQGQKGVGKTHLLGWVREQVQDNGGYFFLIAFSHGDTFWPSVVESILDGLWREAGADGRQVDRLLKRLGALAKVQRTIEGVLNNPVISKPRLESFIARLSELGGQYGPQIQDTARALVLYASRNPDAQDIAKDYFLAASDVEPRVRSEWGIRGGRPAKLIVQDLSRLIALTGQSVMAVDQIDTLIARYATSWDTVDSSQEDAGRDALIQQLADGLMGLEEITRRTLLIVACLPNSWRLIQTRGVDSVQDRFREVSQLARIPTAEVGRRLIEKRFTRRYREIGFSPPYSTWPVVAEAFAEAVNFTPRALLQRIEAHAQYCLDTGVVVELRRLDESLPGKATVTPVGAITPPVGAQASDLRRVEARFQELKSQAEVEPAFDPKLEDRLMPELLAAGLTAWIQEQGGDRDCFALDPPPSGSPALHARLRKTLNEAVEAEAHWAFRAISSPSAVAALKRIRSATTVAGIEPDDPSRRLFLLRNAPWSKGPKTTERLAEFRRAGGVDVPVTADDLRTFAALGQLLVENDPGLRRWLAERRPASGSELLARALPVSRSETSLESPGPGVSVEKGSVEEGESPPTRPIPILAPSVDSVPSESAPRPPEATVSSPGPELEVGRVMGTEIPVALNLESLRKHAVIFAGTGSGKTVLLRRLVEEAALQGVSSIVLDPNNDLARLGEAWPDPPDNWGPGDPAKAERYLADTDVVVWTPRRESGRPISFQPLPDFAGVIGDADEFQMAVDVAFAALAPRARADGRTRKAQEEQAVLRESIEFFAHGGGGELEDLIEVMNNLPPAASRIGESAVKMAAAMARTLTAAMVNDPLFGGSGESFDPAVLLTPPPGKRARVSVISFIGLQADTQRQGFVSQLQMALFSWFKKHPSRRPLGGLLVMDEAQTLAPSGAMTAATESTLVLASQARKYGLGLVFATQAPKGLHNRIAGNAATQFYGLLNSPSQIEAAREIARAKGGDVSDISRFNAGDFYLAVEGASFDRIRTSYCLSYHGSPLSADEVIARARLSSDRGAVGSDRGTPASAP